MPKRRPAGLVRAMPLLRPAWATNLIQKTEQARKKSAKQGYKPLGAWHEVVGVDFAGAGAPLIALAFLGVPCTAWASDIQQHCREWMIANFAIRQMFSDMCDRDHSRLSATSYTAGFPCKPWSLMNDQKNNMGFRHKQSKPLPAMFQTIRSTKPRWFLLENVLGLTRWWDRFKNIMRRSLPAVCLTYAFGGSGCFPVSKIHFCVVVSHNFISKEYWVVCLRFCPSDLGDGVRRPRLYFLGVRSDSAVFSTMGEWIAKLTYLMKAAVGSFKDRGTLSYCAVVLG